MALTPSVLAEVPAREDAISSSAAGAVFVISQREERLMAWLPDGQCCARCRLWRRDDGVGAFPPGSQVQGWCPYHPGITKADCFGEKCLRFQPLEQFEPMFDFEEA
jgi:hypothetical protein